MLFKGGSLRIEPVTSDERPELSVVLPMYNEEGVAQMALDEVRGQLERLSTSYEILCIDDGSLDGTLSALAAAASADERIRPVVLSRNYGKEAALAAGLSAARGEAVLLMDSDLQHPPDLIPEMVSKWREGFDVVNAVKSDRGEEGMTYRFMAWLFYRLMGSENPRAFQGSSDFKLLDRQVVDALINLPEKTRFFRGLVAWVGFRATDVRFKVAPRHGGSTKWSLRALIRYSLRNLISFSEFPLKVVAGIGFATLIFAAVVAVQTLYRYVTGSAITGFTTVILLQLVLGGLLLTSMGVLALYMAQLYAEVKARPTFIVRRDRPTERVQDRPPPPMVSSDFHSKGPHLPPQPEPGASAPARAPARSSGPTAK